MNNSYENIGNNNEVGFSSFRLSFSRETEIVLSEIKNRLEKYPEIARYKDYITVLPLLDFFSHFGEATSYGVIGFSSKILDYLSVDGKLVSVIGSKEIPTNIVDCLIVHEILHVVFSQTFSCLFQNYKDLLLYFHNYCLSECIKKGKSITYNQDFIKNKRYLYITEKPNASDFLEKYLDAFLKDMIINYQGNYILPFSNKILLEKLYQAENRSYQYLYKKNEVDFMEKIISGFVASENIEKREKSFDDLYKEEGFVNYLSGLITGVDVITEMNKFFPQDKGKLANIKLLQNKGLTKEICLDQVKTRKDIDYLF